VASFIWFTVCEKRDGSSEEIKKNEVAKDFLRWVLTDGQLCALKLGYPALPKDLVEMELQQLISGVSVKR
jgi:ABC-type phosphate transport system substrate-binding protein